MFLPLIVGKQNGKREILLRNRERIETVRGTYTNAAKQDRD